MTSQKSISTIDQGYSTKSSVKMISHACAQINNWIEEIEQNQFIRHGIYLIWFNVQILVKYWIIRPSFLKCKCQSQKLGWIIQSGFLNKKLFNIRPVFEYNVCISMSNIMDISKHGRPWHSGLASRKIQNMKVQI